jgi:hypothetical protein
VEMDADVIQGERRGRRGRTLRLSAKLHLCGLYGADGSVCWGGGCQGSWHHQQQQQQLMGMLTWVVRRGPAGAC